MSTTQEADFVKHVCIALEEESEAVQQHARKHFRAGGTVVSCYQEWNKKKPRFDDNSVKAAIAGPAKTPRQKEPRDYNWNIVKQGKRAAAKVVRSGDTEQRPSNPYGYDQPGTLKEPEASLWEKGFYSELRKLGAL